MLEEVQGAAQGAARYSEAGGCYASAVGEAGNMRVGVGVEVEVEVEAEAEAEAEAAVEVEVEVYFVTAEIEPVAAEGQKHKGTCM